MIPESGFSGLFGLHPQDEQRDRVEPPILSSTSCEGQFRGTAWNASRPIAHWHATGDAGVAWHGEMHNAHDLCRQLGLSLEEPLPSLLLAAWRRWSEDCFQRFDGVFCLALRSGEELVLYRDPSGLRNLYCHAGRSGQMVFATDLDTLLRMPGTPRQLARRSLHEYLRFLDVAAPSTLYEDVQAVEAGQPLRWSVRGTEVGARPAAVAAAAPPDRFDDAVAALDAHLQRSLQARLDGAVRPAAFLSGGIDSTLLCAIAAQQRRDITAVTVGFDAAGFDESPVAERIAAHLGVAHEVLRFGHADLLSAFERLARQMDQPTADPATPATVLAFDHCRSRFDTVLDGTGADEVVGAMPPRHVRLAVAQASRLPGAMRRAFARWMTAVPGLVGYAPILDFEHPADTMIRWHGFTRTEIEGLCGEPVSFEHTQFYRTFARFPRHAHFERYSALVEAMPCERLNQAMLVSGLQVRFPFWDRDTDRFIRQLRTDFRFLPGQPKRILRALLAGYVPAQIWDRPKHGFNFPLQQFLAAGDHALVRRYLEAGRWLDRGLLRADAVRSYARQFMAGDQRLMFRVWALVVLGAWLEAHDELH